MSTYWGVYGLYKEPGSGAAVFLKHNVVGFGWDELPDLTKMTTVESLKREFDKVFDPVRRPSEAGDDDFTSEIERNRKISKWAGRVYRFIREMKIGDKIVLPTTGRTIASGSVS